MPGDLTDRFGRVHRYLRVSLTDQCNFRCRYCMPEDGIAWLPGSQILSDAEIVRVIRILAGMGVGKVRFTGGEPTLRPGLEGLISSTKSIPGIHTVAMTTNGSTLSKKASDYRLAGLDIINISLDSLNPATFKAITLRDQLPLVLKGIHRAARAGFEDVKINVVAMKGVNSHELLDFVDLAKDLPVTVRFIEFMPFLGNRWSQASLLTYREMRSAIEETYCLVPLDGDPSAVGKDFRIPGFVGKIGFVTSMTETFCGDCDRIRLTADGSIKPCLFSPAEINLRHLLRGGAPDGELESAIQSALLKKPREHRPMTHLATIQTRSMIQIGG